RAATLAALILPSTLVAAQDTTLHQTLLRAKPAVVLVVSEVGAEVTLKCGGEEITAKAAPYRESATGFLVNPRGWLVTNAHVVAPGYSPPPRMARELAEKAFRAGCLPSLLSRR